MTGATRILVVDDETENIDTISSILREEGFEAMTAGNGSEAIDQIRANPDDPPSVVVLDWNMPQMNGIDFLKTLKADPLFQHIPVIMQTANTELSYLESAIREGAFYFLTKPFNYRIFRVVVDAAVRECARSRKFLDRIGVDSDVKNLLKSGSFYFQSLADAEKTSSWLAHHAPPERRIPVVISIKELLINAIEHGNLGITYDEKTKYLEGSSLLVEVERRQRLPRYASRKVRVDFEKKENVMNVDISDEGQGFDFTKYLKLRPERLSDLHGNGIAMARINLTEMEFIPPGNRVHIAFAINSKSQA